MQILIGILGSICCFAIAISAAFLMLATNISDFFYLFTLLLDIMRDIV